MKGCRRCGCVALQVVRESIVRRGRHEYAMCWYRCPRCHEVRLSYRLLDQAPDAQPALSQTRDSDRPESFLPSTESDPILSH